ncbi:uncharacterized protein MELLADRAFT_35187 [Melampsora larici-populina 98AG31]|uniref:6,7-dimethyl-8-ribityllumazine synthase n=1 Tax=Melampsora larici-populina (strain 98AG31 / pathotype 3-4-7) TaxID=747676 RepID=F4RHW5_MELLP|nr:uncharacterized protein MELLADRAFT_35187 [Melampsora larici-populina 98AG31]EGG07895.1 hypothetical protein MELLADRAFT_35187 [Melampsora larici-populina 98AG31]
MSTIDATIKGLSDSNQKYDGADLEIVILHTRWNQSIITALVTGAIDTLLASGVKREKIFIEDVPGSYELPWAASHPRGSRISALIAIGTLIKGSTMHFEYICDAVSHGLMKASMENGTPVIFGVLTCLTELQAQQRAGLVPGSHNHGEDWAKAAVECGVKRTSWSSGGGLLSLADKDFPKS